MQRPEQKTVQFSNLSEDHKAQFLHFLIKNNICFQQGKENCTAKISIKNKSNQHNSSFIKKNISNLQNKKKCEVKNQRNSIGTASRKDKVLKEINVMPNSNRCKDKNYDEKQLKTPTKKNNHLRTSSLSCKAASQTLQKNKKTTPKSGKPSFTKTTTNHHQKVSEYDQKYQNTSKNLTSSKRMHSNSKERRVQTSKGKSSVMHEKQSHFGAIQQHRKSEVGREKPFNKYHHLFETVQRGRAIKWPLNMLQRTIEQVYDEIFTRNTQCLQTRNIDNALKTLHLSTFPKQIEHFFYKKFKTNKLASTNLNNMLYSLSYHMSKESPPIFLKTFEDFILDKLQHEDILYYLFARNVLKKDLKAVQKAREQSRHEGTYFPEPIKYKQIPKLLKNIIGKDNQMIIEYKQLIMSSVPSEQVEAYEFLRILLNDFHQRRILNSQLEQTQSTQNHNFSYEQPNEQLTFGQDQYEHNNSLINPSFWECLTYSPIQDSLMELILQKLSNKSQQFLEILASDMNKHQNQLQKMQVLLQKKAQSLAKAVFEMNKMKWLKELSIICPNEEDMAAIENLQMKLKRLREVPSGKQIGQFCKNILTVQQLLNQLQIALTCADS